SENDPAPAEPPAGLSYERLLALSRVLPVEDYQGATEMRNKSAQIVGQVLKLVGCIDDRTFKASLRCYELMFHGKIGQDDAVAALDYCLHKRAGDPVSFDKA